MTQEEFGALVGISQRAVSELVARGVLVPGATWERWVLAYCWHLRSVGEGRVNNDLARNRARAARATADRMEMEIADTRRNLAPTAMLEQILADVMRALAAGLAQLPDAISAAAPELPAAAAQKIAQKVADLAAVCLATRLTDADRPDRDDDDEDGQA